jgi:c-di-GMP-binding flagellar brake protein YcgR
VATQAQQRKHPRFQLTFPIRVRPQTPAAPPVDAATENISATGIYFKLSEDCQVGSKMQWELTLPPQLSQGEKVQVRCEGRIVRIAEMESSGRKGVGATIDRYEFIRPPKWKFR